MRHEWAHLTCYQLLHSTLDWQGHIVVFRPIDLAFDGQFRSLLVCSTR